MPKGIKIQRKFILIEAGECGGDGENDVKQLHTFATQSCIENMIK